MSDNKKVAVLKHTMKDSNTGKNIYTQVASFWDAGSYTSVSPGIRQKVGDTWETYPIKAIQYEKDGKVVELPLGKGVTANGVTGDAYLNYYPEEGFSNQKNERTATTNVQEFPEV